MDFFTELGFIGLFISAFLAATILPLSSEIVVAGLLVQDFSPMMVVLIATLGNVLGSLTNYGLGYWASLGLIKKWVKMTEEEFVKAEHRFQKYGIVALLFAWVPVIGDPLTVMAGILRIHLGWFILLVTAGKFCRYLLICFVVTQ